MGAASEAAPRLPDGQGVPKVRKSDKMAIVRKNRASVAAVMGDDPHFPSVGDDR